MHLSRISDELISFLRRNIDSIGELEVLLLLYSDPIAEWSATSVQAKLRSSELAIKSHLNSLYSKDLVAKINQTIPTYSFSYKNPRLSHMIDELSKLYPSYQAAIISLIYNDQN